MTDTQKSRRRTEVDEPSNGWTDDEVAAMQERAKEMSTAKRSRKGDTEGEVLAKIAEMPESDRVMAERIHAIVKEHAPVLEAKTWYGMPAYAKDGKVICFFKAADKFKTRYATFGFEESANIDDGTMWPTSWGLTKLTPADEKLIAELVKKSVS